MELDARDVVRAGDLLGDRLFAVVLVWAFGDPTSFAFLLVGGVLVARGVRGMGDSEWCMSCRVEVAEEDVHQEVRSCTGPCSRRGPSQGREDMAKCLSYFQVFKLGLAALGAIGLSQNSRYTYIYIYIHICIYIYIYMHMSTYVYMYNRCIHMAPYDTTAHNT